MKKYKFTDQTQSTLNEKYSRIVAWTCPTCYARKYDRCTGISATGLHIKRVLIVYYDIRKMIYETV